VFKSYLSEAGKEVEGSPKGHRNAEEGVRGLSWSVVLVQVFDDVGTLMSKFGV
jgi:hypothetical protein